MAILEKFRTPTFLPFAGDDGNFAKAFLNEKEESKASGSQPSALPAQPTVTPRPKPNRKFKTNCIFSSTSCI